MGQRCVLRGCKNKGRNTEELKYHRFPRDPLVKQKWEEWVSLHNGKVWTAYKSAVICSVHFRPDQYVNAVLLPESIPSIAPPPVENITVSGFSSASVESVVSSSVDSIPSVSSSTSVENVLSPPVTSIPQCIVKPEPICASLVECNPPPLSAPVATAVPAAPAQAPVPPVELRFMAVPVLSNSMLSVAPNMFIKVVDQQQLPSMDINQQQLSSVIEQPAEFQQQATIQIPEFITMDKKFDSNTIDPNTNVEIKLIPDSDPLSLYGDLSQFIIFKPNACPSSPTAVASSETNIPLPNGLCDVSNLKVELDPSVLSSNLTAANIKIEVEDSSHPVVSVQSKEPMDTLCHIDPSETNAATRLGTVSSVNVSALSCAESKTQTHLTPAGDNVNEIRDICKASHGTQTDADEAVTTSIQNAYQLMGGGEDVESNGDPVFDDTCSVTNTDVPSSPESGTRKRHIDIQAGASNATPNKRIKNWAGEMQPEDFESPASRVHNLSRLKDIINDKNRLLDNTQRTVRRLKERMKTLESFLAHLKEDTQISDYVRSIIQQHFPILDKP